MKAVRQENDAYKNIRKVKLYVAEMKIDINTFYKHAWEIKQ